MKIIGITGVAGSGKTTAAQILCRKYGFEVAPFAGPLKAMLAAIGVPPECLWGSQKAKNRPLELLGGKSAREAMQTLGTDWGRDLVHPDLWVKAWEKRPPRYAEHAVADDVRFQNEADMIRSLGGIVIKMHREGAGATVGADHASEKSIELIEPDVHILNYRDEAKLEELLDRVVFRYDAIVANREAAKAAAE